MAKCETCGNDYDKTFTMTKTAERMYSIVSNAWCMRSRQNARTAIAASLAMAWRLGARFITAPTA